MEVQHMQFVMNLASSQIQSTRNIAISYANMVSNTMQLATTYANSLSEKLEKIFEHLIARSELSVKVMGALNSQYEVKLKSALSALEGFKLELSVEQTKKDVELMQIKFIEAQINVQAQEVNRYSAIIDAISRKSALEELKLKSYSIRSDIFKTKTQATIASFDIYKASIDGDRAKLEGEISKVDLYKALITSDQLNLESQIKAINAAESHNNAKVSIFKSNADVYRLDVEASLQKFIAQSDVKKLTQDIYGKELNNAIESFKANLEVPKIMLEAQIREYELSVNTAIEEAKIDLTKLQLAERASEAAVSAYQSMASSAIGSLNSMVSDSTTTTA